MAASECRARMSIAVDNIDLSGFDRWSNCQVDEKLGLTSDQMARVPIVASSVTSRSINQVGPARGHQERHASHRRHRSPVG